MNIAKVVLFLASDQRNWITGQNIMISGGVSAPSKEHLRRGLASANPRYFGHSVHAGRQAEEAMIQGIHHVAILTSNIERIMDFYCQTLGCEPVKIVSVDKPGLKLRTAMLSLGASHLQLIEPEIGPGVEQLRKGGEGSIFEMALEVNDIEKLYDHVKAQGIAPISLTGEPIQAKFLTASSGNRYFYLPRQKPQGTNIEIYQVVANKPQAS